MNEEYVFSLDKEMQTYDEAYFGKNKNLLEMQMCIEKLRIKYINKEIGEYDFFIKTRKKGDDIVKNNKLTFDKKQELSRVLVDFMQKSRK